MSTIIRLMPGLIAAVAALIAMQLIGVFTFVSQTLQIVVFLVTYIVVHLLVDGAMRKYGKAP